jgi:hypothetical protein
LTQNDKIGVRCEYRKFVQIFRRGTFAALCIRRNYVSSAPKNVIGIIEIFPDKGGTAKTHVLSHLQAKHRRAKELIIELKAQAA